MRGPFSTPITPLTGSLFHADPHPQTRGVSSAGIYRHRDLTGERVLVARVDRVEAIDRSKHYSFELDGIDADISEDEIDKAFNDPEFRAPFALVRIIAPEERLINRFGAVPAEGSWFEVTVTPPSRRSGIPASVAQLVPNGYTDGFGATLAGLRLLQESGEIPRPFPEAGASVPAATRRARRVIKRSALPAAARATPADIAMILVQPVSGTATVSVRDVGQASFATLLADDGSELAHFDAGWPISYNDHTAPPDYPLASTAPVILSHWDWDHLHAWHSIKALRESCWIVPDQQVGPGASKLANTLHAKNLLKVHPAGTVPLGLSQLLQCTGPGGLNDTGLALDLTTTAGKRILLIGDASYLHLGAAALSGTWDAIVATHHGAEFTGAAPIPAAKGAFCIISVGHRNVYRHPSASAITTHKTAGWRMIRTAKSSGLQRGDRSLP